MKNILRYIIFIIIGICIIYQPVYCQPPYPPSRVGGTIVIDNIQMNSDTFMDYNITITDINNNYISGCDVLDINGIYIIDIPNEYIGEILYFNIYDINNNKLIGITTPKYGIIIMGETGSSTYYNIECDTTYIVDTPRYVKYNKMNIMSAVIYLLRLQTF